MDRDEGIAHNRDIIQNNLELYATHYWALYERYHFTFAEGYRCWLMEFYLDNNSGRSDDDDEAWRG